MKIGKPPETDMKPPPIQPGYKANFKTLLHAGRNDDLALVSCIDKASQKPVIVICAMQRNQDKTITPIPLAKMFDGDPFDELEDPTKKQT